MFPILFRFHSARSNKPLDWRWNDDDDNEGDTDTDEDEDNDDVNIIFCASCFINFDSRENLTHQNKGLTSTSL